ncbi:MULTISPECIES: DUF1499 domain-containing protein [Rhodobacterales]|uniref:DUF1499 domain-containing protein n=2 Tax=Phaeobacter gallaeciensis TaxID=60890 RepID=A0AAW6KRT2_9RHOB|nr:MULTISPECIES: DUF1499 domain-containing protein [Phaeobacter]MDF1770404.1 DUF1499 domain-containing protein [Pseudophaeobacter sp. bin_em_oilr2.035]MEE2633025.1 DUF1499 domain-containing protein [Pseudomonadota bacterium]MDE4062217.1 DUF1499 domain-containing protein [Phaeobacter gallaeciensis]MDE4096117.1 DUF1499 domain-containing protein [Phaeobacter gallaeciensis]MDE4104928.1 DUF1499 domain-containing protein [Phaeobacter gallaeciensis]
MGRVMLLGWIVLAAVVVVLGFIRLAPSDPLDWNTQPELSEDKEFRGGIFRVVNTGPDGLRRFDRIAGQAPRTQLLAGSVEDQMVTYVTRTKLFGFPDYTTARQDGELLKVYARLRFGRSDLGSNKARIDNWLSQMEMAGDTAAVD